MKYRNSTLLAFSKLTGVMDAVFHVPSASVWLEQLMEQELCI